MTLKTDIDQLVADGGLIHQWTSGDQNTTVSLNGVLVRSPAKLINDYSNWLVTNMQSLGTVNPANVLFTGGSILGLSAFSTSGNASVGGQLSIAGNVAIGAPQLSGQNANWVILNIGNGTLQGRPSDGAAILAANADSQNNRIVSGYATEYYQTAGAHSWSTSGSGAAGSAVSFSQGMMLTNLNAFQAGNSTSGISFNSAFAQLLFGGAEGSLSVILGDNGVGRGPIGIYSCGATHAPSTAACSMSLYSNSTSGRSINAGGTINASGADYAEYETKNSTCGTVSKGQIIGFDSAGLITDKFSQSVSFGIKSTNPNLVGGDAWGSASALNLSAPMAPVQPIGPIAPIAPVQPKAPAVVQDPGTPPTPITSAYMHAWYAYQEYQWAFAAYNSASAQYQTDLAAYNAAETQYQTDLTAYNAAETAYQAAETQYQTDLANFNAALEAARQKVDRIAYCGKVPVNVTGAAAGDYIVAAADANDNIIGQIVTPGAITFAQYWNAVGRVRSILTDGRAEVVVIMG